MKNDQPDNEKIYLITGVAGFIGFFLSKKLLEDGCHVVGVDTINNYYDITLKHARIEQLMPFKQFTFAVTYASTDLLQHAVGFKPKTSIRDGLQKFANWYISYYNIT